MNILIIEDDDDICLLYSIWLKEYDHHYVITNNCSDAIYEYKRSLYYNELDKPCNYFDLIVLDYDLPSKHGSFKQNGLYIAKKILQLNTDQRMMFASAWPKKAFIEYVSTLRSVPEVLPKPFEKEEFINLAEKIHLYSIAKKITMQLRQQTKNPINPDINSTSLEAIFKLMNDARKELMRKDDDFNILEG